MPSSQMNAPTTSATPDMLHARWKCSRYQVAVPSKIYFLRSWYRHPRFEVESQEERRYAFAFELVTPEEAQ
jgi:hypothetical protein